MHSSISVCPVFTFEVGWLPEFSRKRTGCMDSRLIMHSVASCPIRFRQPQQLLQVNLNMRLSQNSTGKTILSPDRVDSHDASEAKVFPNYRLHAQSYHCTPVVVPFLSHTLLRS
ncbi:hypothetical protein CSKR_200778 [Clonorchis sinensis]|uniref:Uncharacterized protein n=1 Tax=Clonorchis sinensis TaxID=79923 RepID=A0A8T1MGP6_CLOSI|nr:hypothetical protein CSKR_200778 [Clonorchis sinensis]